MEELRRSGNRGYAIQVDVKVIPRRAMLRMETNPELEAQVVNILGMMVGDSTQWSHAWRLAAQPMAFFRGCKRW